MAGGAARGAAARGAAARVAAETGAVEAGVARVGTKGPPIRAVTSGVSKMWPYEPWPTKIPEQTAITSVARTERMNPALVNKDEFEKAIALLKMQVQEVGQGVRASNPEEIKRVIWKEVLNRNPQLKDFESPTLNPALYQLIDDYVSTPREQEVEQTQELQTDKIPQTEIPSPAPLTVTPPVAQPQPEPAKFTIDTGIEGKKTQTEPEMQKQPMVDPLAQTILVSALGNVLSPKLAPLPQLSKIRQQPKTATGTKQARKPEEEEEEQEEYLFEPRKPVKKEMEKEVELDTEEDPLKQFLQKKSLGDYSSVFLLK